MCGREKRREEVCKGVCSSQPRAQIDMAGEDVRRNANEEPGERGDRHLEEDRETEQDNEDGSEPEDDHENDTMPVSEETERTVQEQALPFTSLAGKYETTVYFDPQTVAKAQVVQVAEGGSGWKAKMNVFGTGQELKEAYLVLQPHALFWFKSKNSVKAKQVFVLDSYRFETPPGSFAEGEYPLDVVQKSRFYSYRFYMPNETSRQEWADALREQSLERWKRWTMTERIKAKKMAVQLSDAMKDVESLQYQLAKADDEKKDALQVLQRLEEAARTAEVEKEEKERELRDNIQQLEDQLHSKSEEADSLDRDLGDAATELHALSAKLEDKELTCNSLESQMAEMKQCAEEQRLQVQTLDATVSARSAEVEQLKTLLVEAEETKQLNLQELTTQTEELKLRERKLSSLQERQSEIEKKLESANSQVESLQSTVRELNATLRAAEAEQSRLQIAEARLLTKIDMLDKTVAGNKEEKDDIIRKMRAAEEEAKESQIGAAKVQAEMERLLDKQEAHNKEDNKLVEELYEEKRRSDKLKFDLEAALSSSQQLQATIAGQTTKLETLRLTLESKDADVANTKEQMRAEQQRCTLLEAKLQDCNSRITALQAENLSLSEETRKLRTNLLEKTDAVERLEARTSAFDSYSTKQSHEIQTVQMLLAKARSEIHYMEASLNSKSFELEELRRSLENSSSTREQMLAENSRLVGETKMLQDKNARLQREKSEVQSELSSKEARIKALENVQSQLADYEEQIRSLSEKLMTKNAELESLQTRSTWDRPTNHVPVQYHHVSTDNGSRHAFERVSMDNEKLQAKLKETEQEIGALRTQLSKTTEAQLAKERKHAVAESERLRAAQQEADAMKRELLSLQAKNKSNQALEKEYTDILEEIQALERRERERESDISAVKAAGVAQNAQIEALNAKLAQAYSLLDAKIEKLSLQESGKSKAPKKATPPAAEPQEPPRVTKKTIKKKSPPESMIPQAVSYGQYRGGTPAYGATAPKPRSTF